MFDITTRTLDWTLTKGPLVRRHPRRANSAPSIIMDALDLYTNLSGYGWNWSHRVHTPQKTRSENHIIFALSALLSAAVHIFVFGISHRAMLSFAGTEDISKGFTIFDATLPFFVRYFRASIFAALTWIVSYTSSQVVYQLSTVAGVLFFRQDTAQWPPAFDAPWRATSLGEFWGRRWHQWCRRKFLFLGGYPLSILLGRPGIILGGFLASAVVHDILLVGLAGREAPWSTLIAYCIMAMVVLAEYTFYRLTGRKVGGVVGWVWTMAWLLLFAALMTDGWARAGGQGDSSIIDVVTPLRVLVERMMTGFDAWLRAI